MNYNELRISKLRQYLFGVVEAINTNCKQINADMLPNDIDNYSLDKIPVQTLVERWITGLEIHRDLFSFRSRCAYSNDVINNLLNIGFFEMFENVIREKNKNGDLPDIEGIQSIECLNCGTMVDNESNTSEFDIQLQITYKLQN